MTPPLLDRVVDLLRRLAEEKAEPPAARDAAATVAAETGIALDLVWEREAYDRSVHYDALVRLDDGARLSIAYCPERALPWPLRGVHRRSEADLLRVDDATLSVLEAMVYLDVVWDDVALLSKLVDACIVQGELEHHPVDVAPEDVAREVERFRRAHGLYTGELVREWLEAKGLTAADLERTMREQAMVAALRERIAAGREAEYAAAHPEAFAEVRVAAVALRDDQAARDFAARATDRGAFYAAAERAFRAGGASVAFRRVTRAALGAGSPVRDVAEGEIVGPARLGPDAHVVALVLGVDAGEPDVDAVREAMFAEWLRDRRRNARVEWNWGDTRSAAAAVS